MFRVSRVFPFFLLMGFLFLIGGNLFAVKICYKYLTHYSSNDYNHHAQNWKITQAPNGIIIVCNQAGVLYYDGSSWKVVEIPNWSVFSATVNSHGTIYIGGYNEMGYLAADENGCLQYHSIIDYLQPHQKEFANVWDTFCIDKKVYFKTSQFLFCWEEGKMSVLESENTFNKSFLYRQHLYLHDQKAGLLKLNNKNLTVIPGGELFAGKKIVMVVEYEEKFLLIGTRDNGFYLYDGSTARPFVTEVDDYLLANHLYQGIRLSSGDFALATLQGGVVVMDSHGKMKHIINTDSGLPDNHVNHVFEDRQGNLWMALNNGLAKVEYASPFSTYNENAGLKGIVLTVTGHKDQLYAGTTSGLFIQTPTGKFRAIAGISSMCWSIISYGDSLLAACNDGIFIITQDNISRLAVDFAFCLLPSKLKVGQIWVGTKTGLLLLKREKGKWLTEIVFPLLKDEIRSIIEDPSGILWLGTLANGIINVNIPGVVSNRTPESPLIRYDQSNGLPRGEVHVFWAADHIMIATEKGIYKIQSTNGKQSLVPDLTLGPQFNGGTGNGVFRISQGYDNNVWIHSRGRNLIAILRGDNSHELVRKKFLRLPIGQVNCFYHQSNMTWIAGNKGLVCCDNDIQKKVEHDYATIILSVSLNENPIKLEDSILSESNNNTNPMNINFADRNLSFQFAAPFFEDEKAIQYQYFLEGYEKKWSRWYSENKKEYTNLDAGDYCFRVRAKNIYETVSREALFRFFIPTPWYRAWWAYTIYALGVFLMMFLIVKRRSRHLEKIVKKRTAEIHQKNIQLQEQSVKLKEMDGVKSRFFANISHQFRTPLTLIMGPLEQILTRTVMEEPLSFSDKKDIEKKSRLMLRNSNRLLSLINQLLELAKFDSGKIKLQATNQDIVSFLKGIVASFDMLASQKELDLYFKTEYLEDTFELYFDTLKLEEVFCNLLNNALKFTPAGGEVTLSLNIDDTSGYVEIIVSDSGVGIPKEDLSHIFDRFYQSEHTPENHFKGSGIGLAIAKEVVELHYGTISVINRIEVTGTQFIIHLPKGRDHLQPSEILSNTNLNSDKQKMHSFIQSSAEESEPEQPKVSLNVEQSNNDIILVVEDNGDVREYIRSILQQEYTVVEAVSGKEGIHLAKEIIPDIIISDIMMPEIDGNELCRHLKNHMNTSHIPIILLTAKAAEENILQGLEDGVDDYITKPFSTKILKARIKNLIALRKQFQQNLNREMSLQPAKINISTIDKEFLRELKLVLSKHISDPDFGVEELSKKLYMGRTTLYRKIQALSGETPTEFIRSFRLKRGAELLQNGFGSVLEVACEVGFSSANYFTKCFKEKFHQLPSHYSK